MPIGSAKIGVLGAGLVPGGTQTFNASGTFTVPPGVKKVNITGKGGTGNPGNAGNPGNTGNAGAGGGGGAGAYSAYCDPNGVFVNVTRPGFAGGAGGPPGGGAGGTSPTTDPQPAPTSVAGNSGSAGGTGTAGNAGTAGNPGNTGGTSSGICKNFTGGAGGNAGAAGNAGAGGSGGNGGGGGGTNTLNSYTASSGSGGNGGGAGLNNNSTMFKCCDPSALVTYTLNRCPAGTRTLKIESFQYSYGGGGGAGETNDGGSGTLNTACARYIQFWGGAGPQNCMTNQPSPFINKLDTPFNSNQPSATAGPQFGAAGNPGGGRGGYGYFRSSRTWSPPVNPAPQISSNGPCPFGPMGLTRTGFNASNQRAGGGGGSGGAGRTDPCRYRIAGGSGGGGGRGLIANPGGTGGAGGSGAAATPSTVNCVSVTPGSSYPITVASPGGQIVISWNPQ